MLTDTLTAATLAEVRWAAVPLELIQKIDAMTGLLVEHATGPETTITFDAIINEWLEPYGLGQFTVWNKETRVARTFVTTLEALKEGQAATAAEEQKL